MWVNGCWSYVFVVECLSLKWDSFSFVRCSVCVVVSGANGVMAVSLHAWREMKVAGKMVFFQKKIESEWNLGPLFVAGRVYGLCRRREMKYARVKGVVRYFIRKKKTWLCGGWSETWCVLYGYGYKCMRKFFQRGRAYGGWRWKEGWSCCCRWHDGG